MLKFRAHPSIIIALVVAILIGGAWWFASNNTDIAHFFRPETLREIITRSGPWGPLTVIVVMAIAIVFSPLPSAPIALAAGAAFGHTWGTVYVLIGAEIGAVIAFAIARIFGRQAVRRIVGDRLPKTRIATQNGLTAVVFISRLLPFLSFDAVSYAAGLTRLTATRFAVATLLGMVPASFLLTHLGTEFSAEDEYSVVLGLSVFALVMVIPAMIVYLRRKLLFPY